MTTSDDGSPEMFEVPDYGSGVAFDSNARVLPASKAERRRLALAAERAQQKRGGSRESDLPSQKPEKKKRRLRKLQQLKKKQESTAIRESTLKALEKFRLPSDFAEQLCASASHMRKQRKKKCPRDQLRQQNVEDNSSQTGNSQDGTSDSDRDGENESSWNKEASIALEKDQGAAAGVSQPSEAAVDVERGVSVGVSPRSERTEDEPALRSALAPNPSETFRRDDVFLRRRDVVLSRTVDIERQRLQLPSLELEQEIVDTVTNNDVVVITGATGCGKSTQVPQFLYEAGFNTRCSPVPLSSEDPSAASGATPQRKCPMDHQLIGITQPRRVAVTSVCRRVEEELNAKDVCGFQIRYDSSSISSSCCLKFMTDGILLREVQSDFLCSRYSVIVLDEAHERSVNCDILIGLLSRSVALRRKRFNDGVGSLGPLRLVIMSATLRLSDFTENSRLFAIPPPVIHIPACMHPVTLHFVKTTPSRGTFVRSVVAKTWEIHKRLPPGSILVFVTGRRDVESVCAALAERARRDAAGRLEDLPEGVEGEEGFGTADLCDDEGGSDQDEDYEEGRDHHNHGDQGAENQESLFSVLQLPFKASSSIDQGITSFEADAVNHTTASLKACPANCVPDHKNGFLSSSFQPVEQQPSVEKHCFVLSDEEDDEAGKSVGPSSRASQVKGEPCPLSSSSLPKRLCFTTLGEVEVPSHTKNTVAQDLEDICRDLKEDPTTLDHVRKLGFDPGVDMPKEGITTQASFRSSNEADTPTGPTWKGASADTCRSLRVVPLYALLPMAAQVRAFEPPRDDERVIIVATNVAETSLTLPNIRYVVDGGLEKRRQLLASSTSADGAPLGVTTSASIFTVQWVSKASADQRAGRAGRTGPGHCYRLYSSAVYTNQFADFPPIGIHSSPLDSVCLFMASLGIKEVERFPFPTPPPLETLRSSQRFLMTLGALKRERTTNMSHEDEPLIAVTTLGRLMARLPVSPRFAVALIAGAGGFTKSFGRGHVIDNDLRLIGAICGVVACLTVGNIFAEDGQRLPENRQTLVWKACSSDIGAFWWILRGYAVASDKMGFARINMVNEKPLSEALCLYAQLIREVKVKLLHHVWKRSDSNQPQLHSSPPATALKAKFATIADAPPSFVSKLVPALHNCLLTGLIDNIAIRADLISREILIAAVGAKHCETAIRKQSSYVWGGGCGYLPYSSTQHGANEDPFAGLSYNPTKVLVHRSSCMNSLRPRPALIAFFQILAVDESGRGGPHRGTTPASLKRFMRECFSVDPRSLGTLESPLVEHSDIVAVPPPSYSGDKDCVMGFAKATYRPLEYALPSLTRPLTKATDHLNFRYVAFAKALLEGQVIKALKALHNGNQSLSYWRCHPSLLTSGIRPDTNSTAGAKAFQALLTKHWRSCSSPTPGSVNPLFVPLLTALQREECDSRAKLESIWRERDASYLAAELRQLLVPTCPRNVLASVFSRWGQWNS